MPVLQFEDQIVHYDTHGTGRPFLFMHGLGADRRQGQQLAAGLHDRQLIVIDMPGHGESLLTPRRDRTFRPSFRSYAAIARCVLDRLGIERCDAGGISMGAGLALAIALQSPMRFRSLVLVRPAWLHDAEPRHLSIIGSVGRWIEAHGTDAAERRLQATPAFVSLQRDLALAARSIHGAITRPQAEDGAEALVALVEDRPYDDPAALATLAMPVLVIANGDDPLHPEDVAERLADTLSRGTLVRVASRYREPERHREAVCEAIASFLAGATSRHRPEPAP